MKGSERRPNSPTTRHGHFLGTIGVHEIALRNGIDLLRDQADGKEMRDRRTGQMEMTANGVRQVDMAGAAVTARRRGRRCEQKTRKDISGEVKDPLAGTSHRIQGLPRVNSQDCKHQRLTRNFTRHPFTTDLGHLHVCE